MFTLNYDTKKLTESFEIDSLFLERIKHSVSYYESLRGKYPRWLVLKFADKIVEKLSSINEISSLKVVGSLRRRKAEIKDIDILVLPEFNDEKINYEK